MKAEPKVKALSITVEVPVQDENLVLATWSIHQWESLFISYRDNTRVPKLREQYDVARAVLKWASTCGAITVKLSRPRQRTDKVHFTFEFANLENMVEFNNGLESNVIGAVK